MVGLTELLQGSSSSASTHDYTNRYDVFLSFRGVDTRLNFTDHLHKALEDANLKTFLADEAIETGLSLKPELESAIRASRASIIVLSKNYASSTWCLNELVLILEEHRNSNHIVIPIFFHVEATDVRKQQCSFGDAMTEHKQRMEEETDAEKRSQYAHNMELWKKALVDVAGLKGKDAKGRKETEFIEEIVNDVYSCLGSPLRSTLPLLIGMDNSIIFITSWLADGSSHIADILTIVGMGGIGKTSLAKYAYGLHRHEFHASSFIEDVSRRCADKFNGLLELQQQLCGDIAKTSVINQVNDVYVYTSRIENALARKKVFVVLDDIDSLDQLDVLLGNKGFHPASKIIITTKDASLTERCALFNQHVITKHTQHILGGLYEADSLKLLSLHAFNSHGPKKGYEEVSRKVVKYCGGHPLALKVLGRSLQKQDVAYWEEHIEGLQNTPDSPIRKSLQMSFDTLSTMNDKELFKHIACFFVGVERDYTEIILTACGIKTKSGITSLIDRCLISIGCDNKLMMHQLLQEMGKDLVRQESPEKPRNRSRLWCHEETVKVLKQKKGMENLLGLALDMRMLEKEKLCGSFVLETDALNKIISLKLLQLNYVQINESCVNLPPELRWLCMHGFPLRSVPFGSPMEKLVALDMSYSNIESFDMSFYSYPQQPQKRQKLIRSSSKETRLLGSLKILNLSYCEQLHSIGGFLELPALERLIVRRCIGLVKVCESIQHSVDLVLIDLRYCNKLERLPRSLCNLMKVKTLLLDAIDLCKYPIEGQDMDSPEIAKAKTIGINSQTSSFSILKAIPHGFKLFDVSLPCSLVRLSLINTNLSNDCFPMDFSCLSNLKDLYLDGNPITSMPDCVRSLPRLEKLTMDRCEMLKSVEHPPCTLRELSINNWRSPYNNLVRKIVFDPKMSPLKFLWDASLLAPSSFEIEGMIKIQPIASVDEKVLRSLGWTSSEFLKKGYLGTSHFSRGTEQFQIQMYYEFGIFSTLYVGEEMPSWISQRRKGPSISFTIPSSPNKLTGLNFCYVRALQVPYEKCHLPVIMISNMTKSRTWIYHHYIYEIVVWGECLIMLSHWMCGANEMEDGDLVRIIAIVKDDMQLTRECGVGFVYDDGNIMGEEEEAEAAAALGYYKSWNHIIGGDLFAFQRTASDYILHISDFYKRAGDDISSFFHVLCMYFVVLFLLFLPTHHFLSGFFFQQVTKGSLELFPKGILVYLVVGCTSEDVTTKGVDQISTNGI